MISRGFEHILYITIGVNENISKFGHELCDGLKGSLNIVCERWHRVKLGIQL